MAGNASDSNDFEDLEELDPAEFDLPDVEEPSLESILKESNDDNADDPLMPDFNDYNSDSSSHNTPSKKFASGYVGKSELDSLNNLKCLETMSIKSGGSYGSSATNKKKGGTQFHGPVLAFYRMQALSNLIMSSAEKINSGRPTAMAVSQLIAIGTTHGLVLVFDKDQKLAHALGSVSVGNKFGPVTALGFNVDCDRLLVGYARGQILMYDVKSARLLRTITDAHPPGSSVLHVKFTDDPTLAVCNDSGGSVFELNFNRGEVCTLEPLHISKNIADHPLRDRHLLAMGTLTKVLVVTLRPQIKVLFSHPLKEARNLKNMPLLSWQLSVFMASNVRSIDAVLLFARGDVMYFFQVKADDKGYNIQFTPIRTMNITYKLINIAWLNSKTILTLDSTERLHVIDADSQTELETVLLESVNLLYNSSTFKSIATGGNVSKALAVIGEQASYHSFVPYNGSVLLLGESCVYATKVRQWNDRIRTSLGWPNGHQRALELAMSFYNGTAMSVVGLTSDVDQRHALVSEKILEILVEYVDLSMTKLCPDNGKLEILIEYFKDVVPVCVDHCLHIDRVDVLCGRLYQRFKADCIAHTVFLECLEPYILDERLKSLSPAVMQDFVKHYEAKGMLSNVEACLIHLDAASLDLHQVLNLCWSHGLFDAILSINNRVMADYIGPLTEMITMLSSAMSIGSILSDKMMNLGSKLLVYISCCLAGVGYPCGILDEDTTVRVKKEMYQCLTDPKLNGFEQEYPILKILLQFSAAEMLNVLSMAFSEPEFQGEDGSARVQQIVDVLLRIMVETPGFTPGQIGTLFVFLARQVSERQHGQHLRVNKLLIHQIVEYLTTPAAVQEDGAKHEEKQQALVQLIRNEVIGNADDYERLVVLVDRAGFFDALRLLHGNKRRFDLIFETYLKDPAKQSLAFHCIRDTLNDKSVDDGEKELLVQRVSQNIKRLIDIDSDETANLVTTILHGSLHEIATKLKDQPQMLYFFLKGLFNPDTSHYQDVDATSLNDDIAAEAPNPYLGDAEMVQVYLTLMCQFDRDKVLPFLKTLESNKPSNSLDLVRRYHINEATSYLLEETGDYAAAFKVLHKAAKDKLGKFVERCEHNLLDSVPLDKDTLLDEAKDIVRDAISLCQRASSKLTDEQTEKMWFPLLDTVIGPRKAVTSSRSILDRDGKELESILKELEQHVLTSMMSHMSLPALLQKIIQDPAFDTGNFGEIKDILLGMLESYQYERTLLDTTLSLLSRSGTVYHESCLKFDPGLSPAVYETQPSLYESPRRARKKTRAGTAAGELKPLEKCVLKERKQYVDRNRQVNNVSKIFANGKATKGGAPSQNQGVFRRDGSLFAFPVAEYSEANKTSDVDSYTSKIRTLSLKSGEMKPQDFKLSVAAPTKIF